MVSAITPITMAGATGVLVVEFTLERARANGRLLSRAMANTARMQAVWMVNAHTMIAIAMAMRKIVPAGWPNAWSTRYCRPPSPEPSFGSERSFADKIPKNRSAPPIRNDAMTARRMARGELFLGSFVSSPRELAVSNPNMTNPDASAAIRNDDRYPPGLSSPVPLVSKIAVTGWLMWNAKPIASETVAMSSMTTPVLLMIDMSFTP